MSDVKLIEAVKAGDAALVKVLVESGTDLDQQDEQGWTALSWAAGRGDLATVRLLVESGADIFKAGRDERTPYMIALAAGRVEAARFLKAAEEKAGAADGGEPGRRYCKAYYLNDLRRFPGWIEPGISESGVDEAVRPAGDSSPGDLVYLHQDLTVTRSMWHGEGIIFDRQSPEWREFCAGALGFKVPDDFELIASAGGGS
jgi:ankyrin repeat protein